MIPVIGLTLTESVGYTHATNSTTLAEAGVVAGDRLLDVPEVTSNTSATYRYPLPMSQPMNLLVAGEQQLRGFDPGHHLCA